MTDNPIPDREKFTVEQQQRMEALNFATALEARRLEKIRFTDREDDPAVDVDSVLTSARAFAGFLKDG